MAAFAIHVVPGDNFGDWVVRADIGQEFDHYPTREAAERVAQEIARERDAEFVVDLPDGKTRRTRFAKSWAARLFRRQSRGIARRPVTPSCRQHARGSMPAVAGGA
ncbi:DUF2188 domain-containing protein [Bradyrhizobium erythrophlei]|uniref:DUF2188 domain-containing protein n=1 Tax=Bradyrhizobium erythrophlei TaxID=1437360 RepID=UPI00115FD116